jgi:hypothetical protein
MFANESCRAKQKHILGIIYISEVLAVFKTSKNCYAEGTDPTRIMFLDIVHRLVSN